MGSREMTMKGALAILISIFLSLCNAEFNPYEVGPYGVKTTEISKWDVSHTLHVWSPDTEGYFPLVYGLTGFAGLVPPSTESIVFSHIASYGFTVVAPHKYLTLATSQYDAEWLVKVDEWVQKNLVQNLIEKGFNANFQIDFENTFMFAHSSGNHIITNYMKLGCHNVKGISMLSPVDGVDPYGFVQEYCITPGEKLNFEVPTLIMTSGLDGIPGISNTGGLVPPCAPDELSNNRFWDALNGRAWFNNATLFGHVDFLDPGATVDVIDFLHFCASNPQDEIDFLFRLFVGGQTVSLFTGLLGECHNFMYLSTEKRMPTRVQIKEQNAEELCPFARCVHYGN